MDSASLKASGNRLRSTSLRTRRSAHNEALGRIQGFTPSHGYLLGRGWKKGTNEAGSTSCLDRLARVPHEGEAVKGLLLRDAATRAVAWLRSLKNEGASWNPRIRGSRPELRPNVKAETEPWSAATKALAIELDDLSLLWQARADKVEQLIAQGIDCSSHPDFKTANVTTASYAPILEMMLAATRDPGSTPIRPAIVRAEREQWGQPAPVEFFVDFETVSSIKDDFTRIPEQNGNPRIFMIGCGHPEDGQFRMRIFTADDMSLGAEARIIEEWLGHMAQVRQRLDPQGPQPLVFHWSPAETATLTSAINAARGRHQDRQASWVEPHWFDFLKLVVKVEPVVVAGASGFGLKAVAKAMRAVAPDRISAWPDGVADGMGAMVAGWWCEDEAKRIGCSMKDIPLMKEVEAYNEIDCRVMWDIVSYLREYP